ncbi:hypothetical protein Pint_03954 [Pistacia integerrima]|uniref:Uncharacterized protein n=1 Tax=Pistacia integerrima TaxID=434235 RepID=A0ACC0ZB60_9ROSI|nr:hypothetical protein Pint_03954 [Pistacia integerrima]
MTSSVAFNKVAVLLLNEITPKSIAVHYATEVARFVVRPVAWFSMILNPVGRFVKYLSMGMLKALGLKGRRLTMYKLVPSLVDFHSLCVIHQYSGQINSWVPVFEQRVDNIVGIAYAMDLLDYVEKGDLLERTTVGDMAHKPAYFVPDSMSVWNLLRDFHTTKVNMAVVLNVYGGTMGIVTLEDVAEEIVGEIFDENDSKVNLTVNFVFVITLLNDRHNTGGDPEKKTGYTVMRAEGIYDVDANTSIDQLSEDLNIKMPEHAKYLPWQDYPVTFIIVKYPQFPFICRNLLMDRTLLRTPLYPCWRGPVLHDLRLFNCSVMHCCQWVISEAFGYIPRTGECMKVVLEKENQAENEEHNESGSDRQELKEKHLIYKLEVWSRSFCATFTLVEAPSH